MIGWSVICDCACLICDISSSYSLVFSKTVSEYDQEIPQSQTADNPMAPRGRAAQPSRDTRNYLNCQLLTSHNSVADGVKPEHDSHTSDICHVVTACVGLNQKLCHHVSLKLLLTWPCAKCFQKCFNEKSYHSVAKRCTFVN